MTDHAELLQRLEEAAADCVVDDAGATAVLFREAAAAITALVEEIERLKSVPIVGWAVFTDKIEDAALYCFNSRDDAFSAAHRWKASISAVAIHPKGPDVATEGST